MAVNEPLAIQPVLKIHPGDNVLVALTDLAAGSAIDFENEDFLLLQNVGAKHKFFTRDMKAGEEVIMYGSLVGKVQCNVSRGELMTTANTKHAAGSYGYHGLKNSWEQPDT